MNILSILLAYFFSTVTAIWPLPVEYEHGDTVLWLKKDVPVYWYKPSGEITDMTVEQLPFALGGEVETGGYHLRLHKIIVDAKFDHDVEREYNKGVFGDDIIEHAIETALNIIFDHGLYPWKFHPRNWTEPSPAKSTSHISRIVINQLNVDPLNISSAPAGSIDESYDISLTSTGAMIILGNTSIGISHALTTFTQLFYTTSDNSQIYTPLAPLHIRDYPLFAHRGINLDVSRHFFPLAVIKRQITAAAYNKMNRFHLHVTDGQSWPLEIPSLPDLSRKGAYRHDFVYSTEDYEDMQRHAALLGVQLITEIDMPGHTSSIHHAYPDLIAAFGIQRWEKWAAEPPSGTLKLNSSKAERFLDTLFEDVLPRVERYTGYFHTGGDEVNSHAYTLDETVGSEELEVLKPLMQRFVNGNHERIRKRGLRPMVWEEMLLQWDLDLADDVVVQSWRSDEAVRQIVEKGYKALVGNYKYWYLDCGKGQWLNLDPSVSSAYWPYNDYCAPFHNWRLAYSYDPLAGIPEKFQHLIIGGEAHMWAEQTDSINVDQMVWPRGSAVAEVLWSGAKDTQGRNRSQIEASPRLSEMRERLVALGIGAEPIQMPYCTMEGAVCQLR